MLFRAFQRVMAWVKAPLSWPLMRASWLGIVGPSLQPGAARSPSLLDGGNQRQVPAGPVIVVATLPAQFLGQQLVQRIPVAPHGHEARPAVGILLGSGGTGHGAGVAGIGYQHDAYPGLAGQGTGCGFRRRSAPSPLGLQVVGQGVERPPTSIRHRCRLAWVVPWPEKCDSVSSPLALAIRSPMAFCLPGRLLIEQASDQTAGSQSSGPVGRVVAQPCRSMPGRGSC